MLDYIKSKLIFKKVFSFLRAKIILKVANYNKSLQNKLGKSLIFYKVMSRKYILYEGKNKGKLYDADSNKLLYIGEFINGKKNGKGKEYYKVKLLFEGEYLNGKRNGKAKEYNSKGNLLFEGEYLNGKRNGKGKEYDYYKGNLLFEGEYLNGFRKDTKKQKLNK